VNGEKEREREREKTTGKKEKDSEIDCRFQRTNLAARSAECSILPSLILFSASSSPRTRAIDAFADRARHDLPYRRLDFRQRVIRPLSKTLAVHLRRMLRAKFPMDAMDCSESDSPRKVRLHSDSASEGQVSVVCYQKRSKFAASGFVAAEYTQAYTGCNLEDLLSAIISAGISRILV